MQNSNVLVTRKRLLAILLLLLGLIGLLGVRAGYWGIYKGDWLARQAEQQWTTDMAVQAKRGSILDRNLSVLAQSGGADMVVLLPERIAKAKNADAVADQLSQILELPRDDVYAKATSTTRKEIWLKRQISLEQAEQVEQAELKGVELRDDVRRYYPNNSFAQQLIGYTTIDGDGQMGIEKRYDRILGGREGRRVAEIAKDGVSAPNGQEMLIASEDGQSVVLALDSIVQMYLENACKELYSVAAAESVQGVVMDVTTGEVLAMSNTPGFDLNNPPRSDGETLLKLSVNNVTSYAYEPGSIFSYFAVAAAMNEGKAAENFDCAGYLVFDGEKISCTNMHGPVTFHSALDEGCTNYASAGAVSIGKDSFYTAMRGFGFGAKTGIDLANESEGDLLAEKYAREIDMARIAAGGIVKTTQMQLINAASSIANGGTLFVPRVVLGLMDKEGNMTEAYGAMEIGKTMSAENAAKLREVMEQNVEVGKASAMKIAGYSAGAMYGKTTKYTQGAPDVNKEISMMIGYAPATNPRYMVMITANGVQKSDKNDVLCAPYVGKVLADTLKTGGVVPDRTEEQQRETVAVPNVAEMTLEEAQSALTAVGLEVHADGTGTVTSQMPSAGEEVYVGSKVSLSMDTKATLELPATMVEVPDFTGLTLFEARDLAISRGLKFTAIGTGKAISQTPYAGIPAEEGSTVTVTFQLDLSNMQFTEPEPTPQPTQSPEPTPSPQPSVTPSSQPSATPSPQ